MQYIIIKGVKGVFNLSNIIFEVMVYALYGFVIYFLITIIRYMKEKINHNKEMLTKISELIELTKKRL